MSEQAEVVDLDFLFALLFFFYCSYPLNGYIARDRAVEKHINIGYMF